MSDWNVKALSSRDRVRSITITNVLGETPKIIMQMENVTVDTNDNVTTSIGLSDLSTDLATASLDPVLGPLVESISTNLTALTQAIY